MKTHLCGTFRMLNISKLNSYPLNYFCSNIVNSTHPSFPYQCCLTIFFLHRQHNTAWTWTWCRNVICTFGSTIFSLNFFSPYHSLNWLINLLKYDNNHLYWWESINFIDYNCRKPIFLEIVFIYWHMHTYTIYILIIEKYFWYK